MNWYSGNMLFFIQFYGHCKYSPSNLSLYSDRYICMYVYVIKLKPFFFNKKNGKRIKIC